MSTMASQITSLATVYSTIYLGANQRKHLSSASLAFVQGIHWWLVNSSHKGSVTRKMFPFDDVIILPASLRSVKPLIQCSKLLPVRQPEAGNFGGGLGTFLNFSIILCLWFEIQGSRTDNFFDRVLNTAFSYKTTKETSNFHIRTPISVGKLFNPLCAVHLLGNIKLFTCLSFSMSSHWNDTRSWNPFCPKTGSYLK